MKINNLKKLILYLSFIGISLIIISCSSKSCNELPTPFSNYEQAITEIKSTGFSLEDSVDTSRSSFIKSASFYSCDSKVGYLIIGIRSTEYIYQNVPISVWEELKEADSFGSFYNNNIKGNYIISITSN